MCHELGYKLQDVGKNRFSHEVRLLAKAAIHGCLLKQKFLTPRFRLT